MEQLADFTGDDYGKLVTSLLVVLDYSKCSEEQIKELKRATWETMVWYKLN